MDIKTVKIVSYTDLIDGMPSIAEAIHGADIKNVTWGDANHTLVSVESFRTNILGGIDGEFGDEGEKLESRLEDFESHNVYIDMEN